MSLTGANIYVYENKFELTFNKPGSGNTFGDRRILNCVMFLDARPSKKGDVYNCHVFSGSYRLPNTNIYYRIPNYVLPKEQIKAKSKSLTYQQASQMTDAELHNYQKRFEGNLTLDRDYSDSIHPQLGFKKHHQLQQVSHLDKLEKRKYKKILQAEEEPGDEEPVGEEPE